MYPFQIKIQEKTIKFKIEILVKREKIRYDKEDKNKNE